MKEDKLIRDFNKQTRVIEWTGGCTYYIGSYRTLKSCCLTELFEMYKAHIEGRAIPPRTKFLLK